MTAHTTDQNGDELSCEFQQIVKVTIPSIDEDKEYLITKWLENNGYKQIYGPKVSNRGDLNDGDTMHLSIRNNVPWTDQVIPVYSQSSSTCSSPGYVYKTGSDMHYNGLDKDGNPWPLVMPGMRLQATKDGVAGDVCRVLEVHQNNGYIKIQCDKQLLGSGLGQYTITVVQ